MITKFSNNVIPLMFILLYYERNVQTYVYDTVYIKFKVKSY